MEEQRKPLGLPDRRANTYEALERRLDAHIHKIEARFQRWFLLGLIAFALIGLTSTAALIGFGINLHNIKENRELFVRNECETTNKRNKDTSQGLILAAQEDIEHRDTAAGKLEVQRRRDVTLALIDLLAPLQNCDYLVDVALGRATPTPVPTPRKEP